MEKVKRERNGKVSIGLWIGKETCAKLNEIAEREELTFSDIVRMALKKYVNENYS